MNERQLLVIVFSDPNVDQNRLVSKALSQFARVKQIDWCYKPIPNSLRYVILKAPYRMLEALYWILRVFREIHRFQADILIVQYAYFCGLIGGFATILSGKKLVIQAVGSDLKIHSQSPIGAIIVNFTLNRASGVICVSEDLERIAKVLGAENTTVIPPPLDLFDSCEKNVKRKDREIISIARLIPIKGMAYLIRAMTHIENARLTIVGDGPERSKLESIAHDLGLEDRILFTGWISDRQKLLSFLVQANVFVLPSLSEGLPRALVEAMSCGLPVVATNVGGIPEIITDGVNGFLVTPRNETVLADAVVRILSNTDFQRKASAENKKVVKNFLLPIVGQKTYSYLKKCLRVTS